jgi:hypothetical protein
MAYGKQQGLSKGKIKDFVSLKFKNGIKFPSSDRILTLSSPWEATYIGKPKWIASFSFQMNL